MRGVDTRTDDEVRFDNADEAREERWYGQVGIGGSVRPCVVCGGDLAPAQARYCSEWCGEIALEDGLDERSAAILARGTGPLRG